MLYKDEINAVNTHQTVGFKSCFHHRVHPFSLIFTSTNSNYNKTVWDRISSEFDLQLLGDLWVILLEYLTGPHLKALMHRSGRSASCLFHIRSRKRLKGRSQRRPPPSSPSKSSHTNHPNHPRGSEMKVSGWGRQTRGGYDKSRVEIRLAEYLFPCLPSLLPKSILFLLPALVHSLIPRYSTAYVS